MPHDLVGFKHQGVSGTYRATDMRKAIDGLMVAVQDILEAGPFSSHLFVFCNRLRDKIKILYWHNNGFWLFYRRLEKQRFRGGQVVVIPLPWSSRHVN